MIIPFDLILGEKYQLITPPVALFTGLVFAFIFGIPYPKFNKKLSKYLLQASVVGLGFGMNLQESLQSGADGMLFTIISVIGVMIIGVILGRYMDIDRKTSYLISSGTAICGGSAIAAVGGVLRANENENGSVAGRDFHTQCDSLIHFPAYGSFLRTLASPVRHLGGHRHTRHQLSCRCRSRIWSRSMRPCNAHKVHTRTLDHSPRILHNVVFPQ